MATVDTLLVKIKADTRDVRQDLRKLQVQTQATTAKMSGSFAKMGTMMKAVVGAVVVQQAVRAGMSLLNLASDAAEMQSKSSVVFGKFTDDFRKFASETAKATGRSRFELEEMGASVQDLFVPLGFARGEATELSKKLTTLAVDVASFNNASDASVMEAFKSAMIGNHETVRRFGIVIDEAVLKQELFRMGIKKAKDEITPQEKALARLNLILAGTTDAQGDAVRTADSYANSNKALQGALKDLGTDLGVILTGPAAKFVQWLRDAVRGLRNLLIAMGLIDAKDLVMALDRFTSGAKKSKKALVDLETQMIKLQETNKDSSKFFDIDESRRLLKKAELYDALGFATSKAKDEAQIELAELIKNGVVRRAHVQLLVQEVKERNRLAQAEKNAAKVMAEFAAMAEAKRKAQAKLEKGLKISGPKDQTETPLSKAKQKEIDKIREFIKATDYANQTAKKGVEQARIGNAFLERNLRLREIQRKLNELGLPVEDARYQMLLKTLLATDRYNQKIEDITESNTEYLEVIEEWTDTINEASSETARYQQKIDELKAAKEQYGRAIPDITQKLEELKQKQFESTEAGKLWMSMTQQLSSEISQGITDVITRSGDGLKNWKESLRGILNSVIQQFIKVQIQAMITGKAIASMGGGFGGGGGLFSSFRAGLNAFGGSFGSDPGAVMFASGGRVGARVPSIVGERGPELFLPNTGGTIKNAHDTRSAMGGGGTTVNQSFNISAGVAQTVRAELMSMLPMIQAQTLETVVDSKRRGGAFADAMA